MLLSSLQRYHRDRGTSLCHILKAVLELLISLSLSSHQAFAALAASYSRGSLDLVVGDE